MGNVNETIQKIVGDPPVGKQTKAYGSQHDEKMLKLLKRVVSHIAVWNAVGRRASSFCVKCQRDGHKDCPMVDMLAMIEELENSQ